MIFFLNKQISLSIYLIDRLPYNSYHLDTLDLYAEFLFLVSYKPNIIQIKFQFSTSCAKNLKRHLEPIIVYIKISIF
jgi:hypothetical protein